MYRVVNQVGSVLEGSQRSFTNFKIVYSKDLFFIHLSNFDPEKRYMQNDSYYWLVFHHIFSLIKILQSLIKANF